MGNDVSQLNGLHTEETKTDDTEFWSHHQATAKDSCSYFNSNKKDGSLSIFIGKPTSTIGALWTTINPLDKFSKNLLKYRHPCIIRYITSWKQHSVFYLATEYVQPLSQVLHTLTPLQICIGLNNILNALVFLHEAGVAHNNVSLSAIYVTGDGQWKLGSLQYLCPFKELTLTYLKQSRIHRYDKAIDPNEDANESTLTVDHYAFAVLVNEVYHQCCDDDVPHLKEFKEYCKRYLQSSDVQNRPKLSEVLKNDFFNHEFISIYKFLNYLPLKSEAERSSFFVNILEILKQYDEETVAKQLASHLLSRLALLDNTARKCVVPNIFQPKIDHNQDNSGFFSLDVFKEHIKPKLVQLFSIRDSQIRKLLLLHFSKFVRILSHEELAHHVLPELLLGIKDKDDDLVSSTLVCLSELVPILGADAVVGGKRSKLFTDGRPTAQINKPTEIHDRRYEFSERLPPVGGEAFDEENKIAQLVNINTSEDDSWNNWDSEISLTNGTNIQLETQVDDISRVAKTGIRVAEKKHSVTEASFFDISELDIKVNNANGVVKQEFDFFSDMTPTIEKQQVVSIPEITEGISSKLNFVPTDGDDDHQGWDDDNWE